MRLGIIHSGRDKKAFREIEEIGLSFIEICCNSYGDMEKVIEQKEEIKSAILDTGVTVSSVGRWNHTLNCGNSLDGRELEGYFSLLDTAIELGAKTFVVGINYSEKVSLYENYSVAIDFFSRLIERAKGKIKIAVQNCDWNNFIVSPREWEVVLGHLPELYLKYDPSHAYNRGADYLAEMSDYGEKIAHFHIKGTVRAGKKKVDDPPAGMDDIRWGSVFAVLYSRGYNGDLSIEPHSAIWKGELGDAGIRFTKNYIEKFLMK